MEVFGLFGPIQWLREQVADDGRFEHTERAVTASRSVEQVAPKPRDPGQLRQSAFDVGEEPLPGASFPPPRRTGWEDDLW